MRHFCVGKRRFLIANQAWVSRACVLPQLKMESPAVKMATTEWTHEQRAQAPYLREEGGHSPPAPVDRVPVSTLCDEYQLHPTMFYRWLKQFFENGAAARPSAPESFPFAMPRLHNQRPKPAQKDRFDGRRPKGIALCLHV